MLKILNGKNNRHNPFLSHRNNTKSYITKENTFLDYEISTIIKRKKKELSIQNQKLKNNKKILEEIKANLKIEFLKYKKINTYLTDLENEIEIIQLNSTKIKKKKLYNISSIVKLKYLFKSSNIIKKYLFLFDVGVGGVDAEKKHTEFLDIIIDNDDEFLYYLNYLEKHYINLYKDNRKEYDGLKKIITDYLKNDNLSYPYNKLLFYLDYIIQGIDITNKLNEKYQKLKEIELKKNLIDIKIKNLESSKLEKENFIKEINSYIELIKKLIKKFIYYQNQYKNCLISKEIFSKKIRKIQSIDIQKWNPETKNNIILKERNNRLPDFMSMNTKSDSNFSSFKNKSTILYHNEINNSFSKLKCESKSQNISRNISFEFLSKNEGPISKKSSLENNEMSYDYIFNTISNDGSDKENISENNEIESPVSKINVTKRKKNTINVNVYKKKLSAHILKNVPICNTNNNDFDSILKKNENKNSVFKAIYKPKNNSFKNLNNLKDKKTNSSSKDNKEEKKDTLKCDTITQDINIVNKKELIFSNENKIENYQNNIYNNDKKKGLYFIKKIKKNKKFVINKDKLFNKDVPTKINNDSNRNKEINKLDNIEKNEIPTNNNNKKKFSLSLDKYINFNEKIECKKDKFFYFNEYKEIFKFGNDLNSKENNDIKNIFYDKHSRKCNDSIKAIRDEMKKRNFQSINTNSTMRRGLSKRNEIIKTDFQNDDCCISCT